MEQNNSIKCSASLERRGRHSFPLRWLCFLLWEDAYFCLCTHAQQGWLITMFPWKWSWHSWYLKQCCHGCCFNGSVGVVHFSNAEKNGSNWNYMLRIKTAFLIHYLIGPIRGNLMPLSTSTQRIKCTLICEGVLTLLWLIRDLWEPLSLYEEPIVLPVMFCQFNPPRALFWRH